MPAWIHDRAERIRRKNPEMPEGQSYAIATQQAHRLGKSPKTFKSKTTGKKERFGTPEGKAVAKAKFDKPLKEYKKTAAEGSMDTALETNDMSTQGVTPEGSSGSPSASSTEYAATNITPQVSAAEAQKELAPFLDNKGELSVRREVTVDIDAKNPKTPTIKTAMYVGFQDEFEKLAASKKSFLSGLLRKGRRAASEVAGEAVEAAPKNLKGKMDPRVAKWTPGTAEHAARQAEGVKRHAEMVKRVKSEGRASTARAENQKASEMAEIYRRRPLGPTAGVGSTTSYGGQLVRMD